MALKYCSKEVGGMSACATLVKGEVHATERTFFFFVFLPFLGPLLRHMEVPRLGVELEL